MLTDEGLDIFILLGEYFAMELDDTLIPGQWYYFYNHPKYLLKHPGGAWQGENSIYMGRDKDGKPGRQLNVHGGLARRCICPSQRQRGCGAAVLRRTRLSSSRP